MSQQRAARPMSYEDTEIYKLGRRLAAEIHKMTYSAQERYDYFYGEYRKLGAMLHNFRESVIRSHQTGQ